MSNEENELFTKETPGDMYAGWFGVLVPIKRLECPAHGGYNNWIIGNDKSFSRTLFGSLPAVRLPTPVSTCVCCSDVVRAEYTSSAHEISALKLKTSANSCQICDVLLKALKYSTSDSDGNVKLRRDLSMLRTESSYRPVLRFCADPNLSTDIPEFDSIGRPIVLESSSDFRSTLLKAWLHRCDEKHAECRPRAVGDKIELPSRLLDVGSSSTRDHNNDCVRLISASEAKNPQYVALSHCWGQLPEEQKKTFCLTQHNIDQRRQGFKVSELPKTFQDAIEVTRELDISYLWIDSLCIIQYEKDGNDWQKESKRMESVFSQAYCTIAATAAANSNAGFLERDITCHQAYVKDSFGKQFYISTDVGNYDEDVTGAELNKRAWVMQERVLSRRTIHFSANQISWECGQGVFCENLMDLQSNPYATDFYTLDPHFPNRLPKLAPQLILKCLLLLMDEYSRRKLTFPTDRSAAMSSLEARIKDSLGCRSTYGIFEKFLHRTLLWIRLGPLQKLEYSFPVPSWSWMAYHGSVTFSLVEYGELELENDLRFDSPRDDAILAGLWALKDCELVFNDVPTARDNSIYDRVRHERHQIVDGENRSWGWMSYDMDDGEGKIGDQYVVVGRSLELKGVPNSNSNNRVVGHEERRFPAYRVYHVLVVRATDTKEEYRRVGIGIVNTDHMTRIKCSIRIV